MSVDLGRLHALVPEQFLDRADVIASLEKLSREGMAKRVTRHMLLDARLLDRHFDASAYRRRMKEVAHLDAGPWMPCRPGTGKHPVPGPAERSIWVLRRGRFRQRNANASICISLLQDPRFPQLVLEGLHQGTRK